MDAVVENLLDFIEKSPTSFHVVDNISERLLAQGYEELEESREWRLRWGGKYFVAREYSFLTALFPPTKAGEGA